MAELKDKIQNALDEGRMLVLGSQVLLGFQFRSTFEPGFEKLPLSSQYLKMSALGLMLVTLGLLLAPAAYHRIVERGEETEHFHRFASRMLVAAMVPLALGVCGDFFVVVRKITESAKSAIVASIVSLLFFYGLWFGFSIYRRNQKRSVQNVAEHDRHQFAS
jgi:cytochrome bd-type quinol oxidase subunit 2